MKKRIVVGLLLSILVLIVSCSKKNSIAEYVPPAIWAKAGPEGDALKAVSEDYFKQTGKKVNVVIQGRAGYRGSYSTALLAKSDSMDAVLDVAFVVPAFAAGTVIENLTPFMQEDATYKTNVFYPIIQSEMQYKNDWYMIPTDLSSESLVYRTDLISSPPQTWNELQDNAKKFTQSINPNSPTKYGYAFAGVADTLEGTFLGIMHCFGGKIVDENKNIFVAQKPVLDAFTVFTNMRNKDKVTPPDITAWDYAELLVALQEGIVAQAAFFTAGMPTLLSSTETPKYFDKLAFVKQPAGPAGSKTRINPLGLMMNSSSKNKQATWDFISWVSGKEGALLYTRYGGTNPQESIMLRDEFKSTRPWYPPLLEAAKEGVGSIRVAEASMVRDTFNKWAAQALEGSITVQEAFKSVETELKQKF